MTVTADRFQMSKLFVARASHTLSHSTGLRPPRPPKPAGADFFASGKLVRHCYSGSMTRTAKPVLTAKRLRSLLDYNVATGKFRWRVQRSGVKRGALAGSVGRKGYYLIGVDQKLYQAGRLAWLYKTGKWPKLEIDYINRDRSDIRWVNLREATRSQTRAKVRITNRIGARGVWLLPSGKYAARIKVNGKKTYLGSFNTVEAASKAYAKAAFGEFASQLKKSSSHRAT